MLKSRNQSIDFLRFIFSIFIIAIHAQVFKDSFPTGYYIFTMGLSRVAVPFFFIVSGYYFYQKIYFNKPLKPYFLKMIKIFIIYELIEIIILGSFTYSLYPNIFAFLFKVISVGLGGAYWYITSLILSLILLTPLWKKQKVVGGMIIGLVLYLFCMTNDSYSNCFIGSQIQNLSIWHTSIWTWPQAGLMESLLYLSIGAMIFIVKPKIKYISFIVVIAAIALAIESYLLQSSGANDGNCYFSLIILVPSIFIWCQDHPMIGFDTRYLGKISLYIYMTHPIVLSIVSYLIPVSREITFIIVTLIVVLISVIIVKFQKNRE